MPRPDHPTSASPEAVAALRGDMLRFAALQLHDHDLAEDVVQEAVAAAITALDRYHGRAQLRTWVFAILRNKIIDIIRARRRRPTESYDALEPFELDRLFNARGHWTRTDMPSHPGEPDAAFDRDEFWLLFEACLNQLPENTARLFMMREFIGLETEEICRELDVTPGNCRVILYRARMRLRVCLDANWFSPSE